MIDDRRQALRAKIAALVPAMAARAQGLDVAKGLDAAAAFPAEDVDALRSAGGLAAAIPAALGGLGVGVGAEGAGTALALLRALGRGNLAVARLFEAHLNALRLIVRFGDADAVARAAADAGAGHLFGLWVTDAPGAAAVGVEGAALVGAKGPCSGAGHCTRALVTVTVTVPGGDGVRMGVVALTGSEAVTPTVGLQGMRAAANGVVRLDGLVVRDWIGAAGDYMREPDFSGGAWRASAAASGALDALVDAVRATLRQRGQAGAPMQVARFGEMVIARETALLWVERMAAAAETDGGSVEAQVAMVNLGRIAVETACLDAIRHAQRSLGLAAFVAPHPVERLARDLGTYLRQPAPDAVLSEAAAWHLDQS